MRDRRSAPAPGRYNVCYVNGFQTQPDENVFWRHRMGLVLRKQGRPVVDGAWGEWLLDIRTTTRQVTLGRIMASWTRGAPPEASTPSSSTTSTPTRAAAG